MLTNEESLKGIISKKITRRSLLAGAASFTALAALKSSPLVNLASGEIENSSPNIKIEPASTHLNYLSKMQEQIRENNLEYFISNFKETMLKIVKKCVIDDETWVIPSPAYEEFYARDSFWLLAALKNEALLKMTQLRFHEDQKNNLGGRIATALSKDGSKREGIQGLDESILFDIIREYELYKLNINSLDKTSLSASKMYIFQHTPKKVIFMWTKNNIISPQRSRPKS